LTLAGCEPPKEEKEDPSVPHPPIEESQPGGEVGANGLGGPADGREEQGGGHYESAQKPSMAATGEDAATFTSEAFRIAVDYPESMEKVTDGQRTEGPLAGEGWNAFADGQQDGQRLLTLKVPGEVDARFRLGASRSTKGLTHCKDLPEGVTQDDKQMQTIDDVAFIRFDVNKVEGDRYTTIRSYRATYTESCYAIDMIVSGTGGEGGLADRQTEALNTLRAVLDGVRFTE
jgi:hypothetical protein